MNNTQLQRIREALAFIECYEPDKYAQQSVQHMISYVSALKNIARKALDELNATDNNTLDP